MTQHPKIYVAGHRGMVGSAIVRQLLAQSQPAERIITRTHAELDLTNQAAVNAFIANALCIGGWIWQKNVIELMTTRNE